MSAKHTTEPIVPLHYAQMGLTVTRGPPLPMPRPLPQAQEHGESLAT
jgi:hypothetical protein